MARRTGRDRQDGPAPAATGSGAFRPSREELLRFIEENPDRSGRRELARAFSLKNADRIWLKDMLRALQDEGLLVRSRKRMARPGSLPSVAVLEIVSRDADGGLLARPAEASGDGEAQPLVAVRSPRTPRGPAGGPAPGVGDRVLARIFPAKEPGEVRYSARVMKLIERRRPAALGVLRRIADGSLRLEPVERRQPELVIEPDSLGAAKPGDLVEVEQTAAARYGLPRGRVTAVLGSLASEKAVSMIAIHAHGIPHVFPPEALAEADAAKPATLEGREDWRDLPLVTIDPEDAKDHDDAVHAAPDEDPANHGGVVVTVAIADVASYVRSGSALDREALRRGNSVYFPNCVVPMLPERISNDLCSLREGEDRPALAVRMRFSADGRKLGHAFHRIMMRSHARLAYTQAQAAIDGRADGRTAPILDTVLRPLWDAYRVLKRGRDSRGPLELDLPERKIVLKPDGTVNRVGTPERLDAHRLIEEFMIQANVAAAETLEAKRQPLVYRIHDAPSLAKQEALREFLQSVGLSLARGAQLRPGQFNAILARAQNSDNEVLVNEMVLRAQSQAEYSPANIGHFGLNLRRYAHFTSPIRRYADLVVHRALIAALALGRDGLTPDEEGRLEETAALISATERRAMAAERETVDRLIAAHLAERVGEAFPGRVAGVTRAGLFVRLPQFGADGFVPVSTLGGDYYIFDEGAQALVGRQSGRGYRLADEVDVRLAEVAPLAGAMRFELLGEPRPLGIAARSYHKARRQSRSHPPRSTGSRRR